MNLAQLHQQAEPLLIANVWNVTSAQAAAKAGYNALATSSSAIAAMLGYQDGEEITFAELEYVVSRIGANTSLPLSVDFEGGYSRIPEVIVDYISRLSANRVTGINIEDSIVNSTRSILDADIFSELLKTVTSELKIKGIEMFINVRTDAFLLGLDNPLEESLKRIKLYEQNGASGIFVPCIVKEPDIKAVVEATKLPVNVLSMPTLPNFKTLKALGVKRISMGGSLQNKLNKHLQNELEQIKSNGSFENLYS